MREKGEGREGCEGGERKFGSESGTGRKRGGNRQAYLRNFQRVTLKPLRIGRSDWPVMGLFVLGM